MKQKMMQILIKEFAHCNVSYFVTDLILSCVSINYYDNIITVTMIFMIMR